MVSTVAGGLDLMRWCDRVYGDASIDDPRLLAVIDGPTFRRLKGIRQAGPSAFAFPFKDVTRHEHSLGVYLLLRRLGADLKTQVAGLLHDVSHTAFSHAVDYVYASDEQDHHEGLKPIFLDRPDVADALRSMGFAPADFYDDSAYPLLERPLPNLCADRLDYFYRDSLACGVSTPEFVARSLASLTVVDGRIAFADAESAREAVALFAEMNRDWWASPTEGFIYNEFGDVLREALRLGVLRFDDLLGDDLHVLRLLRESDEPAVATKLGSILRFSPALVPGYVAKIAPKVRWLDPPVATPDGPRRLSELRGGGGGEARPR